MDNPPADLQVSKLNGSNGGEVRTVRDSRKPNLTSLQIPSRTLEDQGASSTRISIPSQPNPCSSKGGLPPRPNSTKAKPSLRGLLPQRSLKTKCLNKEGEKANLLLPGALPSVEQQDEPSNSRTFSLTRVSSSPAAKRTHSLPVTPVRDPNNPATPGSYIVDLLAPDIEGFQKHIMRSHSVPGNTEVGSLNRLDSLGGRIRVIPVTPRPNVVEGEPNKSSTSTEIAKEEGQDIPEEEAVCRICLIELAEGVSRGTRHVMSASKMFKIFL